MKRTTHPSRGTRRTAPVPDNADPAGIAWSRMPAALFCADIAGHRFEIVPRIHANGSEHPARDGYSLLVDGRLTGWGGTVPQVKRVAAEQAAVIAEPPEKRLEKLADMYWEHATAS